MSVQALLEWYRQTGRDLPWRRPPRTPYRVLVAEVMLQQTRADVAAPRYEAFLARFPDVRALAVADEGEVLRHFEGLGYYARGRNLHRLARIVAAGGGELPTVREELLALPGIGPYIGSAVLAFAYGQPVPALDANVRRIALRYAGVAAPLGTGGSDRAARAVVQDWLGVADPGELHDAMMDLGALVCTARIARCGDCPLREGCVAHAQGAQAEIGVRARAKDRETEHVLVARVLSPEGQAWRPRPAEGLLAGMWEPPHVRFRSAHGDGLGALRAELRRTWGIREFEQVAEVGAFRHAFSHLVWIGRIIELRAAAQPLRPPARWLGRSGVNEVAIPSAFLRALAPELR